MGIPRRIDITRLSPAETAIRNAMIAVEEMPADTRLTDAVIHLQHARDKVADYIDEQDHTKGQHTMTDKEHPHKHDDEPKGPPVQPLDEPLPPPPDPGDVEGPGK